MGSGWVQFFLTIWLLKSTIIAKYNWKNYIFGLEDEFGLGPIFLDGGAVEIDQTYIKTCLVDISSLR